MGDKTVANVEQELQGQARPSHNSCEPSGVDTSPKRDRSRSRTPKLREPRGDGFAAAMRSALCKRMPQALEQTGSEECAEAGEEDDPATEQGTEQHIDKIQQAEEGASEWTCSVCQLRCCSEQELFDHCRTAADAINIPRTPPVSKPHASAVSVDCALAVASEPWQFVVNFAMSLPGARTSLWCPACPLVSAHRWSGPASRADALLRHLSKEDMSHDLQHRRLLQALLHLFFVDPPSGIRGETLQEWVVSSRLFSAAGPLLAKPSAAAQRIIWTLEDEVLGLDASLKSVRSSMQEDASGKRKHADSDEEGVGDERKALRILGRDLTVEGSGLYDEEVPLEGGAAVPVGDSDGPCMGCPLPAGGAAALTCFDLTLSSDEESPPAPDAKGPAEVIAGKGMGQSRPAVNPGHKFV